MVNLNIPKRIYEMKRRLLACLLLVAVFSITNIMSPPVPAQALTENPTTLMIATPNSPNSGNSLLNTKNCFQVGTSSVDTADWIQATASRCNYNFSGWEPIVNQSFILKPWDTSGNFWISIPFSGKCLGVANAVTTDGAAIIQQSCANLSSQIWNVTITSANSVQFRARHSGKCIVSNGAGLVQSGASCTGWDLIPFGTHKRIKSDWSSRCLDIAGESAADGAKVQQYDCLGTANFNQRFHLKLMDTSVFSGNRFISYFLLASHSAMCIRRNNPAGNFGPIVQSACDSSSGSYWWILPVSATGGAIHYKVVSISVSSIVMDVDLTGGNNNGNKVHQYTWAGTSNQIWKIIDLGG
jgi:hypothetical protein